VVSAPFTAAHPQTSREYNRVAVVQHRATGARAARAWSLGLHGVRGLPCREAWGADRCGVLTAANARL
jgi:hypothetical protein